MAHGNEVRMKHDRFLRQIAPDQAKLAQVRSDSDLNEEARRSNVHEIIGRVKARHDEATKAGQGDVALAERDYLQAIPSAAELTAAASKPDGLGRLNETHQAAVGASEASLRTMAANIAHRRDLPASAGLRKALRANEDIDPKAKAEILATLDSIGAEKHDKALAELLATQRALVQFGTALQWGEVEPLDPLKNLTAARAAAVVPTADGESRMIPPKELARLLELSGVEQKPPHAPPMPKTVSEDEFLADPEAALLAARTA